MPSSDPRAQAVDRIAAEDQTVLLYAAGKKIYARATQGRFNSWRWVFVFLTQFVYYITPWISWGDRPAVLFDLDARRFYILDLVLIPQDFIYLTALLLLSALGLFLFTAIAGRLFCGYACPQTVYTSLFMQVERWIEGDRHVRIRRDREKPLIQLLPRRTTKWLVWALISLWTGFTFAGYFTPIEQLAQGIADVSLGHGNGSGCFSTPASLCFRPASCESKSASTCAPTHAFKVPCLTETPWW